MQHDAIAARTWARESESTTDSMSLEIICLLSLLGLVASVTVLLTSSAETIAAMTAALM